jgi:hypothetical protein
VYQRDSNAREAKENCSESRVSAEKYSEAFFPPMVARDAGLARAFHHFSESAADIPSQLARRKRVASRFTRMRNSHQAGDGRLAVSGWRDFGLVCIHQAFTQAVRSSRGTPFQGPAWGG